MNQSHHYQAALSQVLIEAEARPADKAHKESVVILPTYCEYFPGLVLDKAFRLPYTYNR